MAPTLVNTTILSLASPTGYIVPVPAITGYRKAISNTAGNWLICIVAIRQPPLASGITASAVVTDDAHNYWLPVGAPHAASSPSGTTRILVWAAPNARAASNIFVAPTGPYISYAATILEISGMGTGYGLAANVVTGYINSGTSVAMPLATPSGTSAVFTAAATDLNTATISLAGSGFTGLTTVTTSNGTDHTSDLQLTAQWIPSSSGGQTVTWSSTASLDMATVVLAVLNSKAAAVQPNPTWGQMRLLIAPGAGALTPADETVWVDITSRYKSSSEQRGPSYELGGSQAGQYTVDCWQNDGALSPANTASVYNCPVLAWFPLADSIGTIDPQDYSGNGVPANVDNVTFGQPGPFPANGPSAMFNGTSSRVDTALDPVQLSAFSAECWVNLGGFSPAGNSCLVGSSHTATDLAGFDLQLSSSSTPQLILGTGTAATTVTAGSAIGASGWHHIAGTWDGSIARLYVDSVVVASASWAGPWSAGVGGQGEVSAGYNYNAGSSTDYLHGYLSGVAVYGFALSQAQITAHYGGSSPGGLDTMVPLRLLGGWQNATYCMSSMFVTNFSQSWDGTRYGLVEMPGVDGLGVLTGQLQNCVEEEVLLAVPYAYFPCNDAAGSVSAVNQAPGNSLPLTVVTSKHGVGSVTGVFGSTAMSLAGAPGETVWEQEGITGSTLTEGYSLLYNDPLMPSLTTTGMTVVFWFDRPSGQSYTSVLWTMKNSKGICAQLWFNSSGNLIFTSYTSSGTATNTTLESAFYYGSGMVTIRLTSTTWQVTFDAGALGLAVGSGTANFVQPTWMTFNGQADALYTGYMWNGEIAHIAIFPYLISVKVENALYAAGWNAFEGNPALLIYESLASRVERLLSYAGYGTIPRLMLSNGVTYEQTDLAAPITDIGGTTGRTTSTGQFVAPSGGQQLADAIGNIVASDLGLWWAAGDGALTYRTRYWGFNLPTSWTLGENATTPPLNSNPAFAGTLTPWTIAGGTATLIANPSIGGFSYATQVTPSGSATTVSLSSEHVAVTPGTAYTASCWAVCPTGYSGGTSTVGIAWWNSTGGQIGSTTLVDVIAVPTVPEYLTGQATAPAGAVAATLVASMTGTPPGTAVFQVAGAPICVYGGEQPYAPDITVDDDATKVANDAELTPLGEQSAVSAQNQPSIGQNGLVTFTQTSYLANTDTSIGSRFDPTQTTVGDVASWIVQVQGVAAVRISKVTVSAAANPNNWPFVLGVEIGQVVEINRRPWYAPEISQLCMIVEIEREIDFAGGTASVTCDVVPYTGNILTCDDPVRGLLNGTVRMGY
jgi:hypothetical protein